MSTPHGTPHGAPGPSANTPLRLLILGAHPDDAEYHAGGLACRYRRAGHTVRMVSVTDGGAGHHWRSREELVAVRRAEASEAAAVIGAESAVWDFPDGELQPTLELRRKIIAEIRSYRPDLVLTHRLNDYHPDHRAVGQAVQDASFLVTVPRIVPEVPALRIDPVVASMVDLFTVPSRLRPDVVLDVSDELETILEMLACHRSQVFEWLPYNLRVANEIPADSAGRREWLRTWYLQSVAPRCERFSLERHVAKSPDASAQLAPQSTRDSLPRVVEAYELSEYAAPATEGRRRELFLQSSTVSP